VKKSMMATKEDLKKMAIKDKKEDKKMMEKSRRAEKISKAAKSKKY
jgi:hypothetical protein